MKLSTWLRFWLNQSLLLALFIVIALPAFAQETIAPEKVEEYDYRGTQVVKFVHESLKCWGYREQKDKNYFYVARPKDGHAQGRPLYVALHSAGGSGQEEFEWRKNHPDVRNIYAIPDGFYAMFPDCGQYRDTEWWYGARKAQEKDITEELAEKASTRLMPVEKRILAEIEWVVNTYNIDRNRIYLCGNSMGGSGALGIGLRNGDVFAAIKANVPAGIWHAYDRLNLGGNEAPENMPDPPVCLDYSAPNDSWSDYHEALFEAMERRKYSYVAYWGNFGHENRDEKVALFNDLFNTFDWTSIRKNEAYPVFTSVSTDDVCPWPNLRENAAPGQRGAYFRWENKIDNPERLEIVLRLASSEELKSKIFSAPLVSNADVSLRRLQQFKTTPNAKIKWTFGELSGDVVADSSGLVTIPNITISLEPKTLILTK